MKKISLIISLIFTSVTGIQMCIRDRKFSEINMEDPESMNKVATFVMYKLFLPYPMGGFQQQDIINATEGVNRIYAPPPKGLAYWYMKNDHFYLKLDLPAIIIQVMKSQGKSIDQNLDVYKRQVLSCHIESIYRRYVSASDCFRKAIY